MSGVVERLVFDLPGFRHRHGFQEQRADAVATGTERLVERFDQSAVIIARHPAHVFERPRGRAQRRVGAFGDNPAQPGGAREAQLVKLARRIDGGAILGGAPRTDAVEAFEAEPDRVSQLVTARAVLVGDMRGEANAGGRHRLVGGVLNRGEVDVARRIGNRLAQQQFPDRAAAQGRR